tara:strand:- start:4468 stop:4911 length:444 start_codon:yes stop_codon:yes gene_type:complete
MYNDKEYKKGKAFAIQLRRFIFLKSKSKKLSAVISCTPEFIRNYIEFQFSGEMTWDNFGKIWELDHIVPCSLFFDKQDPLLWHFVNIRPLLKMENKYRGVSDGREVLLSRLESSILENQRVVIDKLIRKIDKFEDLHRNSIPWSDFV